MTEMADASNTPLCIVAGSGTLPRLVAEAAEASGRSIFVVALKGYAENELTKFDHVWLRLGQAGAGIAAMRERGVRECVFIGGVRKPRLVTLRPDFGTIRGIISILSDWRGGDNTLLSSIARFFSSQGLTIVGAHEVAPSLTPGSGNLTPSISPTARDLEDIRIGFDVIKTLSPYDVGQAVIVSDRRVLAVEGVEGTDAMLRRVADLRAVGRLPMKGNKGVLVKGPKHGQDLRIDMPTIGEKTVKQAREAHLRGIAVSAGEVLLADPQTVVAQSEAAGLFMLSHDKAGGGD